MIIAVAFNNDSNFNDCLSYLIETVCWTLLKWIGFNLIDQLYSSSTMGKLCQVIGDGECSGVTEKTKTKQKQPGGREQGQFVFQIQVNQHSNFVV